jgi:hypothetical protein
VPAALLGFDGARVVGARQPEFVVVTHWESVEALRAFAGPDWQQAVIDPEEKHMLARVFCDHHVVIVRVFHPGTEDDFERV